jgi:serine/threonine-protein kinase
MVKFLEGSGSRSLVELTRAGARIGTPAYMSPEQVKGTPANATTDVYAAGVLLFELLAGSRPFSADSFEGYMAAHLTRPVPSLAKARPRLARAALFQTLVERAMAKRPASRFPDAGAMLAALEEVVSRLPAGALDGERAEGRAKPPRRAAGKRAAKSRPRLWRAALVLVACAAGGALYLRHERARPAKTAALPAPVAAKPASPTPTPPASPVPPAPSPAPAALAAPSPPAAVPVPAPAPETKLAPEPAPPPEAPAPAEAQAAPAPPALEAKPASGAHDPWQEPIPHALRLLRERIDRGAHVSQRGLAPVYEFARQNPDDPRPWLLLGHAYAQLDWFSDALQRYLRATQIDASSRGDPHMLDDLLQAAAHPVASRAAARAIRDIYGAEALPSVDQQLQRRAADRAATARLTQLRQSLSAGHLPDRP